MPAPARVAKLVDAIDLGSIAVRCVGSSPTSGTKHLHLVNFKEKEMTDFIINHTGLAAWLVLTLGTLVAAGIHFHHEWVYRGPYELMKSYGPFATLLYIVKGAAMLVVLTVGVLFIALSKDSLTVALICFASMVVVQVGLWAYFKRKPYV